MNNERRKAISVLIQQLGGVAGSLEFIQIDEEDAFNAMPEGLQASERGQAAEAAAEALQTAFDGINEAIALLEEAAA